MARTRVEVLSYARPQQIEADGCYAITFIRPVVSNSVMINGYELPAGQSLEIKQNVGDEDRTTYDVVFYDIGEVNDLTVIKIMPE
jgi:uncharacterized protein YfaP (DUF2135 family)